MNRYKLFKAGVSINEALVQLGGDKALYEELLETFKKENRMKGLETSLKSGDAQGAFAAAHALKGESGNMGFTRLYEALCVLVDRLRTGTCEGTDELFAPVKKAYDELMDAIG